MKWRHVALHKWADKQDAVKVNYIARVLNTLERDILNGKFGFVSSYLQELSL